MSLNMNENSWERQFLNQVAEVITSAKHSQSTPPRDEIDGAIDQVFERSDGPDPELRSIFRDLCFAAVEGDSRDWLRARLRDEVCSGMLYSAAV